MKNHSYLPNVVAYIRGSDEVPELSGEVKFYQNSNFVFVTADINGLPKTSTGFFGFHIHEGNSCAGKDFANTKSHYNPANSPHPSHAGDLPPLLYSSGGAYLAFTTDRFTLRDIIGRTVVIHNKPDDFTTQPSGNAGTKIGCGVIKRRLVL